jgi:hypothetical protein
VRPRNSRFAKWLKAQNIGDNDDYTRSIMIWIGDFEQSMQKKEAYAVAYAEVLQKHSIDAYANSRMD